MVGRPGILTRRRDTCLAGAALAALLVLLLVASPAARVIAKWLADPLCHATSGGGGLVLLVFAAASALALAGHPAAGRRTPELAVGTLLIAALLAGTAANLLGQLAAMRALGLSPALPAYFWSGQDNTYSYLFHSHAGKAAMSALLAPLAGWLALDVGQGWGSELPGWVAPACGACFTVAIASYLWLLPRIVARHGGASWVAVLFGLASLNAMKAIFDGGLLTYRTLPSVLVVAAVALVTGAAPARRQGRWWVPAGAIMLLGYAAASGAAAPAGATEAATALPMLLTVLALPAAWGWWRKGDPAHRALRGTVVAGLAATVAIGYVQSGRTGVLRLFRPLPDDYHAWVLDAATLTLQPAATHGESPFALYRRLGDDPLKPRHVFIVGPVTGGSAVRLPIAIVARRVAPDAAPRPAPWRLEPGPAVPDRGDLRLVTLDTAGTAVAGAFAVDAGLAQNNYYVLLHGLAAQLTASGITEFALVPVRDGRDLDRVLRAGDSGAGDLQAGRHHAG